MAGAADNNGCAFIFEPPKVCGAVRQAGSSYCAHHHAACHLVRGSKGECSRLRELDALAGIVGGRRAGSGLGPSAQFLRRLEARSR
jgi:hypothetical protein